jgi:hypothetical protein
MPENRASVGPAGGRFFTGLIFCFFLIKACPDPSGQKERGKMAGRLKLG